MCCIYYKCVFWALVGTTLAVFLILALGGNKKSSSRESIKFTNFTDPIFPSPPDYLDAIWPRTGGQLGQNMFSGWPQYFKAY